MWILLFFDRIQPLMSVTIFLLGTAPLTAYNLLKGELEKATLQSVDESCPFLFECDALKLLYLQC